MVYFSQLFPEILKMLADFFKSRLYVRLFPEPIFASSLEIDESSLEKAENFSVRLVLV
jgi:hypothetical protein